MKLYNNKNGLPFIAQPDPYIFRDKNGGYYIYTTGSHIFSSNELTGAWEYKGDFLDKPEKVSCWGPCIIEIDGWYYLYYSDTGDVDEDDHCQAIRVAVADNPLGPFTYKDTLLPPFSIDPHVVRTEAGIFIFYCNNDYSSDRVGTVVMCDRMENPIRVEGNPVCAIKPTIDEEIFQRDRFRTGEHWHTVEGAYYFHVGTTHFLMYSGACYQNPTYFIGYCVAYGPENVDLRMLEWKKYPNDTTYAPLLKENAFVEGMGHNSIIEENGRYYIVYHGRDKGMHEEGKDVRTARMDELRINGDELEVEITR